MQTLIFSLLSLKTSASQQNIITLWVDFRTRIEISALSSIWVRRGIKLPSFPVSACTTPSNHFEGLVETFSAWDGRQQTGATCCTDKQGNTKIVQEPWFQYRRCDRVPGGCAVARDVCDIATNVGG